MSCSEIKSAARGIAGGVLLGASGAAFAQSFPSKPIHEPVGSTARLLADMIRSDTVKFADVVKRSGISAE